MINVTRVVLTVAFLKFDFDFDGTNEILAGGNYFGVKPFQGRLDSFTGALIKGENDVILGHQIGLQLAHKSVRHLSIINLDQQPFLLVTYNNEKAEVYKMGIKTAGK
jgi:hypothetical protein